MGRAERISHGPHHATPLYAHTYYMSHQYGNKSKSQLTSPTPAQLPAVAVSTINRTNEKMAAQKFHTFDDRWRD
jgi:hypothetical protein